MKELLVFCLKNSRGWHLVRYSKQLCKWLLRRESFSEFLDQISIIYNSSRVSLHKTVFVNIRLLPLDYAL